MTTLATPHNAGLLARSWLTAFAATSTNEDQYTLFRSLEVEHFIDRGLRVTSTDSYVLASVWCPSGDIEAPLPEEPPDETFAVYDEDKRGVAFMKHAAKLATAAAKDEAAPVPVITALVRKARPSSQLTLFGSGEARELVVSLNDGDETVAMGIRSDGYPNWRSVLVGTGLDISPPDTPDFGLSAHTLTVMANVSKSFGDTHPIVARPSSDHPQMIRFNADGFAGEPALQGVFTLATRPDDQDGEG
ncbi:MAG: hypothetical protein AAF567_24330 [Actinomycetota bacterium]